MIFFIFLEEQPSIAGISQQTFREGPGRYRNDNKFLKPDTEHNMEAVRPLDQNRPQQRACFGKTIKYIHGVIFMFYGKYTVIAGHF